VILTGGENAGTLAAGRALRAAGFDPWNLVTGNADLNLLARSRACAGSLSGPDPAGHPQGFVRGLVDAAERLAAVAVMPGTETAMLALAGTEAKFPDQVAVGACSLEATESALAKEGVARIAEAVGLDTPRWEIVQDGGWDGEFPCVVKPPRSEMRAPDGSLVRHSVQYVRNSTELERALEKLPDHRGLVEEYIPGQLHAIAGVFWGGRMVCAVHHAADRIWRPRCGVMAYARTIPPDHELETRVAELLVRLGWQGVFQLQFIHDGTTRLAIDLNPRFYESMGLTIAAGTNVPAIWTQLLLGQTPDITPYRVGVRFRNETRDPRAILNLARRGHTTQALAAALPRRHTTHPVLAASDPYPFMVTGHKLIRRIRHAGWRGSRGSTTRPSGFRARFSGRIPAAS
jgi:predicted ATP-grasp superfamily ATP-dependent carboligase